MNEELRRRVVPVVELSDPRLEDYQNLRDRELAHVRGAFIAESEVVLRVLVTRSEHRVRSVLLAESRLDKLADALRSLPPEVPIFVAPQPILDRVVGFHIHRGVLAAVERPHPPGPEALLDRLGPGPRRVVVLEGLTNHDNVGGVFRNAAAFGADGVLLDHATCDPYYRKAIRVSVAGALIVPFARAADTTDHLAALRATGFTVFALSPRPDARDLANLGRLPERVALLLGTEGPGLRETSMAAADGTLRIDMAGGFDSLNVATTSGIALHALRTAQMAQTSGDG